MFAFTLRFGVFAAVLGLLAASAGAADDRKGERPVELKVGAAAPAFRLAADSGKTWSSADHFGKGWVVHFYPGDFTPGCTAQARAFDAAVAKLTERGAAVVGVSGDPVRTHGLFKKAQKLTFALLSDEDGAVARKFGVPVGRGAAVRAGGADGEPLQFERKGTAARWTFVIGKDGAIASRNTRVTPAQDAKAIADVITKAEQK